MAKQLKGFVTRDDFVTPKNQDVAPIYELSTASLTYAKRSQSLYPSSKPNYCLQVFSLEGGTEITTIELAAIIDAVVGFSTWITNDVVSTKQHLIISYTNQYNLTHSATPLTQLDYNDIISYNGIRAPNYLTFKVADVECAIWLSDATFQVFYPKYDIDIVLPFDNFAALAQSTGDMLDALASFDPVSMNDRIEVKKGGFAPTHTKMLNIPYQPLNTTVQRNCYFAFNIYGKHGNYDHILKLALYNHLTTTLGLDGAFVEAVFPSILNINEFYIIPRWERTAIPVMVGEVGILSQVSKTYAENFDIENYVRTYSNPTYVRNNTYSVPFPYNNALLNVVNGFYSEEPVKDFASYYPDIISVSSIHPDYARMSMRTQHFMSMLEMMISIADADTQTELFNKVVSCTDYIFTIIDISGVTFLTLFYNQHQYYMLPKYELERLL